MLNFKSMILSVCCLLFSAFAWAVPMDTADEGGMTLNESSEAGEAFEGSVDVLDVDQDMELRGFGCGLFSDDEMKCHKHCLSIKDSKDQRIYNGGRCGGRLDRTCICYK